MSTYQTNRARFTVEELEPYDGQWVAFSPDGSRIVAGADDLAALTELVTAAGEDPAEVGTERIRLGVVFLGGGEFS